MKTWQEGGQNHESEILGKKDIYFFKQTPGMAYLSGQYILYRPVVFCFTYVVEKRCQR